MICYVVQPLEKKNCFHKVSFPLKISRWRPKQSPLRRVADEPKKKRSHWKVKLKTRRNKKRAISFSRGELTSFKVITGGENIMGKKNKKPNRIKLFSRLLCNYFETFEIHIHHFCKTAYCMLVSDRSKISYHSRNTIFFETKIKRFLRNWYSATRVSQQETLFFSI